MHQSLAVQPKWKSAPPLPLTQLADDCLSCPRRSRCLSSTLSKVQLPSFSTEVVRLRPFRPGDRVFSAGDIFSGIYIVKSGFFKSQSINRAGELQITDFHFPGEMFGIEGFASSRYTRSVIALETGTVCRVPFSAFEHDTKTNALLVRALVESVSKIMIHDTELLFSLAKLNAERRVATFLIDMSARMSRAGFGDSEMRLCMGRHDIGNYLGLAEETVSRVFTRFQCQGLLTINRRHIHHYDLEKLRLIANDHAVQ